MQQFFFDEAPIMNNNKHWFSDPQSAICNSQWKLSRRSFLTTTTAGVAGMLLPSLSHADGVSEIYRGLRPRKYFGRALIETEIEDKEIFTEGPAVDRAGNVYFTNVPVEKILKWDPNVKKLSVFREHSNKTNGLLFDPQGNLLCCEGGAGRVTRTDMKTGKITVLADKFNGFPLASPNDIAIDKKGHIYFTSRPGTEDPAKGNVNAVYRIDADGSVDQILAWPEMQMPNGIVTSPDDKTLYVIEAHPDADRNRNIMAYDLDSDGKVSNPRVHINFYPGRSGDGMCIDAEGNLYVAAGLHKLRDTSETLDTKPGIHVVSPKGELISYAGTPVDTITNCSFGGKDLKMLYVACGKYLLSIRTKIPGKPAYLPNA
jgi:gluconolactonase